VKWAQLLIFWFHGENLDLQVPKIKNLLKPLLEERQDTIDGSKVYGCISLKNNLKICVGYWVL